MVACRPMSSCPSSSSALKSDASNPQTWNTSCVKSAGRWTLWCLASTRRLRRRSRKRTRSTSDRPEETRQDPRPSKRRSSAASGSRAVAVLALPDSRLRLDRNGRVLQARSNPGVAWMWPDAALEGERFVDLLPPPLAEKYQWAMTVARDLDRRITITYEWARGSWSHVREARVRWLAPGEYRIDVYHLGERRWRWDDERCR